MPLCVIFSVQSICNFCCLCCSTLEWCFYNVNKRVLPYLVSCLWTATVGEKMMGVMDLCSDVLCLLLWSLFEQCVFITFVLILAERNKPCFSEKIIYFLFFCFFLACLHSLSFIPAEGPFITLWQRSCICILLFHCHFESRMIMLCISVFVLLEEMQYTFWSLENLLPKNELVQ